MDGGACGGPDAATAGQRQSGPVRADVRLPVVFTLDELVRRGMTPTQVRTRVARGEFRRLRRGVYCRTADWDAATPERQHTLRAVAYAAAHGSSPSFAFSHATAAAVLELPVASPHLDVLHLTVDPSTRLATRRDGEVDRQVARLRDVDVRRAHGVPITTAARTVVDCLRRLPPRDAVAVADAALRAGLCSPDEVREVLSWQADWPFAAVAALALALVDPRRESAVESRSAVVMHEHGVPDPEPQVRILDGRRRFVARVDFAWLRYGVVGEVDGRVKYERDTARVVEAEKDRQAQLAALGLVVVRWDPRHLHGERPVVVERVLGALAGGDGRRFRGHVG